MSELPAQDRLLPFLLDRISDDHPAVKQEPRDRRVMTPREFRKVVLRDLMSLLNTACRPEEDPIEQYPLAAKSVLNYGMRELAGTYASAMTPERVEEVVRTAIVTFEPRILPHSLQVTAIKSGEVCGANIVSLEIRGEVWNVPMPDELYVRTELDLDTGRCEVHDQLHGA